MPIGDGQFYNTSTDNVSSLSAAFETIANRSQKPSTDAIITKKIAPEFEIVTNPNAPSATIGSVSTARDEVKWDLGNITAQTETMTYYLKVKNSTVTGKDYIVTDGANIDYTDIEGTTTEITPEKYEIINKKVLGKYGDTVQAEGVNNLKNYNLLPNNKRNTKNR